ncbi:uncharacterized protein [Amphiura filiformis]|uniref:uncharacterized protein n=1 Tax=Amphiura filiformis TaxID=82378 RepID=UPI003B20CA11
MERLSRYQFGVTSCPAFGRNGSLVVWTDTKNPASDTGMLTITTEGVIKSVRSYTRDSIYPSARYATKFCPVPDTNTVFVFGGQTYLQDACQDMLKLTVNANNSNFRFEKVIGNGQQPQKCFGHTTTFIASKNAVAVFGGLTYSSYSYRTSAVEPHLFLFDINSSTWRKVWLNGIQSRAFHNAEVVGNDLVIFGGSYGDDLEKKFEHLDIINLETYHVHTVPFPHKLGNSVAFKDVTTNEIIVASNNKLIKIKTSDNFQSEVISSHNLGGRGCFGGVSGSNLMLCTSDDVFKLDLETGEIAQANQEVQVPDVVEAAQEAEMEEEEAEVDTEQDITSSQEFEDDEDVPLSTLLGFGERSESGSSDEEEDWMCNQDGCDLNNLPEERRQKLSYAKCDLCSRWFHAKCVYLEGFEIHDFNVMTCQCQSCFTKCEHDNCRTEGKLQETVRCVQCLKIFHCICAGIKLSKRQLAASSKVRHTCVSCQKGQ